MTEKRPRVPRWQMYIEGAFAIAIVAGIIVEVITDAEVGYIIVTAGSAGVALTALLIAKGLL